MENNVTSLVMGVNDIAGNLTRVTSQIHKQLLVSYFVKVNQKPSTITLRKENFPQMMFTKKILL